MRLRNPDSSLRERPRPWSAAACRRCGCLGVGFSPVPGGVAVKSLSSLRFVFHILLNII